MENRIMVICSITLMICFLFIGAPSAFAQKADTEEFTLEEITVTAEKRETELQKTSMAVSVLTEDYLRETRVESIQDILKTLPNVQTALQGSAMTIILRGLGQDLPGGEGAVAMQMDGTHVGRGLGSGATMFGYFDVERVEMIRGPQGTLYGRSAVGGVLNVISTRPKIGVTEGYIGLEFANYSYYQGEGAINVPISDNFASRLSFVLNESEGQTKDDTGWRAGVLNYGVRSQIIYQPNDDVSVNLIANLTKRRGDRLNQMVSFVNYVADNWINIENTPWNRTQQGYNKNIRLQLNAEFPVGPGVLTFLPTYVSGKSSSSSLSVNRASGEPNEPVSMTISERSGETTKTAELRYSSRADADIQWIGGLYWTEEESPGRGNQVPPQSQYSKAYAGFGQVTYPFSDRLRGIVGARYDKDKRGYQNYFYLAVPTASFEFDYFDWKLAIELDHSEDVMSYFTAATGHRPGGFETFYGVTFDEESLISYEYGLKSRFMDKRLQVNTALFYYDYKDYQAVDVWSEWVEEEARWADVVQFFNVGKAVNYGAEIETKTLLTPNTTLDLAVSYLKNEYESDYWIHETPASAVAINLKGMPFPNSPKLNFQSSIDHTFSFSGGSTLTPRISVRWTGERYINVLVNKGSLAPAYTIVDCSLNYTSAHNWTLNFYANNALDEKYASAIRPQPPPGQFFVGLRREFGVKFVMRF